MVAAEIRRRILGRNSRPGARLLTSAATFCDKLSDLTLQRPNNKRWRNHPGRFVVMPLPNITSVFYGRDVGYTIERIDLDSKIQDISATEARRKMTG